MCPDLSDANDYQYAHNPLFQFIEDLPNWTEWNTRLQEKKKKKVYLVSKLLIGKKKSLQAELEAVLVSPLVCKRVIEFDM